MSSSSCLLLIEMVLPSGNTPDPDKVLDMKMFAGPGGRERTEQKYSTPYRCFYSGTMLALGVRPAELLKFLARHGLWASGLLLALPVYAQSSAFFTFSVSPREDVQLGGLTNAPNGHLSYQTNAGGFNIWVAGRLKANGTNQEGAFLLVSPDWSPTNLAQAQPTFCLGPTSPGVGAAFDRDYAALNAVVPGESPGTLLGFYDAEYHPLSTPTNKVGQPLLSSIGLAISTDNGVTWTKQGQVIQGLDWAMLGMDAVTSNQVYLATNTPQNIVDDGANSPSAVVRQDGGKTYLYLYYSDRTNFAVTNPYAIYLARALLAGGGLPGSWQKWTGSGWGAVGAQFPAAAVMTSPPNRLEAEHPSASFNTALNCWLLFFKTHVDFQIASSGDGLQWNPPQSLFLFDTNDVTTGFPTYLTPDSPGVSPAHYPTQETTAGQGWMYYSSHPSGLPYYVGHRVQVTLQSTVPNLTMQRSNHVAIIAWAPPTPGFGLETTTDLASTNWTAISTTNGGALPLDSLRKFYRLHSP